MSRIPQLPSTDQISDPQVRTFCDALMNAWQVRNGDIGPGSDKFVTYGELDGQVTGLIGRVFGASAGSPGGGGGGGGTPPGFNDTAIRNLQQSVFQSELFRRLGEQIARAEVPRFAVQFVQDAVRATSSKVEAIGARVGNSESAIVAERLTRSDQTTAIASAVNTMWAIMSGGAYNASVSAIIQDGSLAQVSPIAAVAERFNTLQSTIIGPNGENYFAALQQNFNTYVNSTNGRLEAAYTLRVELDSNGRRVVGGFGILATVDDPTAYPRIDFGVRANRFFIASPNPNDPVIPNPAAPFIVTTTTDAAGNPPGVYMTDTFIQRASITSAKITDSIESFNYVEGSAGWFIGLRGTDGGYAEFNDVNIRGTVRSNNFVTGLNGVGWIIRADGSAEFDSAVIRKNSWKSMSGSVSWSITGSEGNDSMSVLPVTLSHNLGYTPIVVAAGQSINSGTGQVMCVVVSEVTTTTFSFLPVGNHAGYGGTINFTVFYF